MEDILKTIRDYIPKSKTLDDLELIKLLQDKWNKGKIDWLISYINNSKKFNINYLNDFLTSIELEWNLSIINIILQKSKIFDDVLKAYFKKDKKYTEDDINALTKDEVMQELLVGYAVLKDIFFEEEVNTIPKVSMVGNAVDMYFQEMRSIPVLDKAKTNEYLHKYQEYIKLSNTTEVKEEKEAFLNKANYYKNLIVQGNLRLVIKPAFRKSNLGVDLLELIQEGNLGLMKAVEEFDFSAGASYSTYAIPWIKQKIDRYIQENSRTIRVPSYSHNIYFKARLIEQQLEQTLKRTPTYEEIAEKMGEKPKLIADLYSSFRDVESLDAPIDGEDDDITLQNVIAGEEFEEKSLNSELVENLLVHLEYREEDIVRLLYGIPRDKYDTQTTIPKNTIKVGDIYFLTRERVRQIEKKCFYILKIISESQSVKTTKFKSLFTDREWKLVPYYINYLSYIDKVTLFDTFGPNLDRTISNYRYGNRKVKEVIRKLKEKMYSNKKVIQTESLIELHIEKDSLNGKSIFEITGLDKEYIKKSIDSMNNSKYVQILYKAFGNDLESVCNTKILNESEKDALFNACVVLKTRGESFIQRYQIDQNLDLKYTLIEEKYKDKTLEEILNVKLSLIMPKIIGINPYSKRVEILMKSFGENFDEPFKDVLTTEEKDSFAVIIRNLIIKWNEFCDAILEPGEEYNLDMPKLNIPKNLSTISSPLTDDIYKYLLGFLSEDCRVATSLRLGLYDGKMYSIYAIAMLLNEKETDIFKKCKKGIDQYTNILINYLSFSRISDSQQMNTYNQTLRLVR